MKYDQKSLTDIPQPDPLVWPDFLMFRVYLCPVNAVSYKQKRQPGFLIFRLVEKAL